MLKGLLELWVARLAATLLPLLLAAPAFAQEAARRFDGLAAGLSAGATYSSTTIPEGEKTATSVGVFGRTEGSLYQLFAAPGEQRLWLRDWWTVEIGVGGSHFAAPGELLPGPPILLAWRFEAALRAFAAVGPDLDAWAQLGVSGFGQLSAAGFNGFDGLVARAGGRRAGLFVEASAGSQFGGGYAAGLAVGVRRGGSRFHDSYLGLRVDYMTRADEATLAWASLFWEWR